MGLKKIIVIAGVLAPVFSAGAFMNLFSGFTVEKEIIVDPDQASEPWSLLKSSDDGYFVGGRSYGAWIAKVDGQGNTLWSFREPAQGEVKTNFVAAAPSNDGGVLLCGNRSIEGHNSRQISGFAVRLDKNGHEISRVDPYLNNPEKPDQLIGVVTCSAWGDGFMVSGGARVADKSADGSPVTHGFPTILRLNGNGTLLWQKNMAGDFKKPLPQSNGDIIFLGAHGEDDGDKGFLTPMDRDGNILSVVKYPSSLINLASTWVGSSDPNGKLEILGYPKHAASKIPMLEIGPDLQITKKTEFDLPDGIAVSNAYRLLNGRIVMLGAENGTIHSRILILILLGTDFSIKAKHEFAGEDATRFADFLPSGKPGEFVTVRQVSHGRNENTAMTFLKLNSEGNN